MSQTCSFAAATSSLRCASRLAILFRIVRSSARSLARRALICAALNSASAFRRLTLDREEACDREVLVESELVSATLLGLFELQPGV